MLLSRRSLSQHEHVPCTQKSQDCHNLCQLLRLWHLCQHRQLCPLSSVPTVPSALFVLILPFLHLYLLQNRFQQCQLCHWCQIRQMFYLSTLGQINAVLCSLVLAGRFYFTIFWDVFRLNSGKYPPYDDSTSLSIFFCNPDFISDNMNLVSAIWIVLKQLASAGSILIVVEDLLPWKIIQRKGPWNIASDFQSN